MTLHRFITSPTSGLGETLSAAVLKPGCRCTSTQDMYMYVLYTERARQDPLYHITGAIPTCAWVLLQRESNESY